MSMHLTVELCELVLNGKQLKEAAKALLRLPHAPAMGSTAEEYVEARLANLGFRRRLCTEHFSFKIHPDDLAFDWELGESYRELTMATMAALAPYVRSSSMIIAEVEEEKFRWTFHNKRLVEEISQDHFSPNGQYVIARRKLCRVKGT